MRTALFWLVTLLLPLCLSLPAFTASSKYFVSLSGSDTTGDGTQEKPWRSIMYAALRGEPGDVITVLPGKYDERVHITTGGAPGQPLVFQAEGDVTMRGFTVEADWVTITGFYITETFDEERDGWGIWVQGSHCTIEDNHIYYAVRGGIHLFLNPNTDPSLQSTTNCVVKNNRLERNALAGIVVHGRNHLVEGNEIWGTIQKHPDWKNLPPWADADGIRFFGIGHIFRKNYIHDITYDDPLNGRPHIDAFQTWKGDWYEGATDIVFEQNRIELLVSQATRENGHGWMLAGASNLTIRNNIVLAYGGINTGGGDTSDLKVINNLFANDLSFLKPDRQPYGVSLQNSPNAIVVNNTFYNQPAHAIYVEGTAAQGLRADYNLIFRTDSGQPWDRSALHDLFMVDPLFADPANSNFHLWAGSPAIDAGVLVDGVDIINDYDGNPRPQGAQPDIGPFETPPEYATVKFGFVTLGRGEKKPVRGEIPVEVEADLGDITVKCVEISLDGKKIYSAPSPPRPEELVIDTQELQDGKHSLQLTLINTSDHRLTRTAEIEVANWNTIVDEFVKPVESLWFGVLDSEKILEASPGWTYATGDPDVFYGDTDRRIRTADSTAYLTWETPLLHDFTLTFYSKQQDVEGLNAAFSQSDTEWYSIPLQIAKSDGPSPGGWFKLVATGAMPADAKANLFRLTLTPAIPAADVHLGKAEFRCILTQPKGVDNQ